MQTKQDNQMESTLGEQPNILILVTKAPFSSLEPYRAYEFAKLLNDKGINPIVFHFMDGIYNLSNLPSHALNFQNNQMVVRDLIESGTSIIACSRCLLARGFWDENLSCIEERRIIPSNTIKGIEVKGIQQLLQFIYDGYKVIKF